MTDTQATAGAKNRSRREKSGKFGLDHASGTLHMGRFQIPMPKSKAARMSIGAALIVGGCLGFLPILGFWMVPLGVVVLSQDLAMARRLKRRTVVRWTRWRRSRKSSH